MSCYGDPRWLNPAKISHVLVIPTNGDPWDNAEFWNWCYENCKSKVVGLRSQAFRVLDKSERNDQRKNKYHSVSYGDENMVILVEDAEDAMLIKLAWGGMTND